MSIHLYSRKQRDAVRGTVKAGKTVLLHGDCILMRRATKMVRSLDAKFYEESVA